MRFFVLTPPFFPCRWVHRTAIRRRGAHVKRIVIIGFGSAGYAAFTAARKTDPKAAITVIDPKARDLMHPCGLPYALEGRADPARLEQDVHLDKAGVIRIRARATRIDADAKRIITDAGDTEGGVPYDAAIICTGSAPVLPPVPGIERLRNRGLYTLATMDDCNRIMERIEGASDCLIIGAGAIGLECAVALRARGRAVHLAEMRDQVLPGVIDADLAAPVAEHLTLRGIAFHLGAAVGEVLGEDAFAGARIGDSRITASLCIAATGFAPHTELARESGIECGPRGIVVDDSLRTALPDVYAAGDCIVAWSVIDKKPVGAKLATSAYKQGTVAGANAAGGAMTYAGTAGAFVTVLGDLEIAGAGYTTEAARAAGYEPVSGKISAPVLPDYIPDGHAITVKILADRATGRLLGAQAVGPAGAAARINVASAAIEFGKTLDDLERVELAYCPAVSEVHDPLLRAADFARRRMPKR